MLTKQTPDTIKASLTIKAQGVENTLQLTFHNYPAEDFSKFATNLQNLKVPDSVDEKDERLAVAHINASIVLHVVKSFDDGTDDAFPLNRDGLIELENYWPGTLYGIRMAYHKVRNAAIEKN